MSAIEYIDAKTSQTFTIREAATILGISKDTLYRSINDGTFPVRVLRISSTIRIPKQALADYLSGSA